MSYPPSMGRRGLIAGAGAMLATPALAIGERPMRIISPFNAGGVNDIVARALAPPLSAILRQPVVVENRIGGGGAVGAAAVARAPADGNTILMGMVDIMAINPFTYRNLPYDPAADFAPISFVTHVPIAIVAGPSRPGITSFAAMVEAARADPGGLSFASWGVGSTAHLAFARVARSAGVEFLHVPFTGQAPAMQSILASQVDLMALPAGGAAAMARDPANRILATAGTARLDMMPAAPTLTELGIDMTLSIWQGLYAPVRTPDAALAQLTEIVHEAMRAPSFAEVLRAQAGRPEPSTPAELAAFGQREREGWGGIVQQLGVRFD